jgi:hypothetical protein
MRLFDAKYLIMQDNPLPLSGYLCYDSAPGGECLLPEHTLRAGLPENPSGMTVL